MPEKVVIADLAREIEICAHFGCSVDEKFARAAAERNALNLTFRSRRVEERVDAKLLLHRSQPVLSINGLWEFADQSATRILAGDGRKPVEFLESESRCDFEIHSAARIVEVGVRRIDRDVALHGQADATLHLRAVAHAFHAAKQQRVCATMRLKPKREASSITASVTSKHNNAPEHSFPVIPICKPALS